MNRILQFGQLLLPIRSFTQQSPFNIVLKTQLVGTDPATISGDGLAKALFVAFGADAIALDAAAGEGGGFSGAIDLVVRFGANVS